MTTLRATRRLLLLAALVLASLPAGFAATTLVDRAAWMQRLSRRILAIMGARVRVVGSPPTAGLLVSNHLGYLDVLAIGSVVPGIFVAKSDVKNWPVVGLLCRLAGSIFVRREQRLAVGEALGQLQRALDAGLPVVLFPEGTSTDGATVLPFKSSLLEAFVTRPATAAAISYELPGGSVEDELCYWRDMSFAPHFWNVLGRRKFRAEIRFGHPLAPPGDRKALARRLHDEVLDLRTKPRPAPLHPIPAS